MTGPETTRPRRGALRLIGVPTDAGASQRGACLGPAALRIAGLPERLSELGFDVTDMGDVAAITGLPLGAAATGPAAARLSSVGALGASIPH